MSFLRIQVHCEIFLLWHAHLGARPKSPPGCCGGIHLERGVQEAAKTFVNPSASRTPDLIFGDVPDLDSRKAAELAADREKWKTPRAYKASTVHGDMQ